MKALTSSLCVIALSLASTAAFAAGSASSGFGGYNVAIPKSRIQMPKLPEPESPHVPDQLDLGASSWAPSGFSLPGGLSDTTSFARAGAPSFYVNYLSSMNNFMPSLDGLFLKAGLNWLSLNRTGKVGSDYAPSYEDQSLQLFSVRIGAEYEPSQLQIKGVQPYAGLAFLPSLGVTGRSAFDDGSSYFGIPIEYTAGAQFELSSLGLGWNAARMDLGLIGTAGTVDHNSVSGIGVKGGIRLAL